MLQLRIFATPILTLLLLSGGHLSAGIASGPMLGPVSMREAQIWLQTESASEVSIVYQDLTDNGTEWETASVQTNDTNNFCITIPLRKVEPGKTYQYQAKVDGLLTGTPAQLTTPAYYHEKAPPPDLRVAVIGAHYSIEEGFEPPYQKLGGGYEIFSKIYESSPDLALWTGHTAHLRPSDWNSSSGYLKRFAHARSQPEMAEFIANVPNYATWGSSDYGPEGTGAQYTYRDTALSSFRSFWPQPTQMEGMGLITRFQQSDVDFFILDVQSHRATKPSAEKLAVILSEKQINWLRQEIIDSPATFKFIVAGAPILNPANSASNLSLAEREQKQLLQMLRDTRVSGLFFISGGKYYGEMTRLVHANSYNLYDLTVGPITANVLESADELNFFRMPGTSTFERQYALIDVSGPEENRQLVIQVLNGEGKQLWTHTLKASDLQAGVK